ncbi:MAG: hypothetical protein KDC73_08050 [Ignavibacteriae bacterium]|nr:hypothetical protein [Ignavibacteriota bacterium]MCB9242343.1 hypothetical protein [Ignavibacteriales bacterium]
MHKSKIIDFLKTLDRDELKRFGDFVSSPYFNKSTNLVKFFNVLKNFYPAFTSPGLLKENIFAKIFPSGKYNEQTLKNLSSQMLKLSKNFLSIEFYEENEHEKSFNLLRKLSLKKLDNIYQSELKLLEKEFLSTNNVPDPRFYNLYRMELERINFILTRDKQQKVPEVILKQGEYYIFSFLVQLSILYNNIKVNENAYNARFDVNLVEEFISNTNLEKISKYVDNKNIEFASIAGIYFYKILCIMYPEKEEYYFKLREFFEKSLDTLNNEELYTIFTSIETYCVNKINRGKTKFNTEMYDAYRLAIKHKILLLGGMSHITAMKFRNIFLCAYREEEYDWADNFVNDYKKHLTTDGKVIADIARSYLLFSKKDYENALENLRDFSTDMYIAKLDMRVLTIQLYYELDYIETLLSALNSFRQFINSNENIAPSTRASHLNFLNAVTNLAKQKSNPKKSKVSDIKRKIQKESIASRKWLLEKADQLL